MTVAGSGFDWLTGGGVDDSRSWLVQICGYLDARIAPLMSSIRSCSGSQAQFCDCGTTHVSELAEGCNRCRIGPGSERREVGEWDQRHEDDRNDCPDHSRRGQDGDNPASHDLFRRRAVTTTTPRRINPVIKRATGTPRVSPNTSKTVIGMYTKRPATPIPNRTA